MNHELNAAFIQGALFAWHQFDTETNGPNQGWLLKEAERVFASDWWLVAVDHAELLADLAEQGQK